MRRRDIYGTHVAESSVCLFTRLLTGGADALTIDVYQSPADCGGWVTFAYCHQTGKVLHNAHDISGRRPSPVSIVVKVLELELTTGKGLLK